jgi:hypothetical protein
VLERQPDLAVYADNVVFEDRLSPRLGLPAASCEGREAYGRLLWSLRFHGALFFCKSRLDLLRVWEKEPGVVCVRWCARASPRLLDGLVTTDSAALTLDGVSGGDTSGVRGGGGAGAMALNGQVGTPISGPPGVWPGGPPPPRRRRRPPARGPPPAGRGGAGAPPAQQGTECSTRKTAQRAARDLRWRAVSAFHPPHPKNHTHNPLCWP